MLVDWRGIVNDPKTLAEIEHYDIWDVYAFSEDGIVFVVGNGHGTAEGEVHVFFKPPARPLAVAARFMSQAWERSGLDRLTALVTRGNTRIAAWMSRYGWHNTHRSAPLDTEVWEIEK